MQVFTPFALGLWVQFGPRTDLQPPTGIPPQFLRPQGSNQQSQLCQRGDWEPCDPWTVQIQSNYELKDTRQAHRLCGAIPRPHSVYRSKPQNWKAKNKRCGESKSQLKKKSSNSQKFTWPISTEMRGINQPHAFPGTLSAVLWYTTM